MSKLRRAWQVFAAAIAFAVFGLGGLLFGLLAAPFLMLTPKSSRLTQARSVMGFCMSLFSWLMRTLRLITVRWNGDEHLAISGAVIAPNHPTLIDVVLLLARAPQLDCIVKAGLLRNPFTRGAVRAAGYIANAEGAELIDRCVAAINAGRNVLIFPEGTRSEGDPKRLRRGACTIAVRAQCPLVPIVIRCEPIGLAKQQRWYDLPAGPLCFNITVLPPWLPQVTTPDDRDERESDRTRRIRDMTRALEECYRTNLTGPHETSQSLTTRLAGS